MEVEGEAGDAPAPAAGAEPAQPIPTPDPGSKEFVLPPTMTISDKLALIRDALTFSADQAARLAEIEDLRTLAGFVHDHVLSKLARLGDTGLLSPASRRTLAMLQARCAVLQARDAIAPQAGPEEEKLRQAVAALREQVAFLQANASRSRATESQTDKLKLALRMVRDRMEMMHHTAAHQQAVQMGQEGLQERIWQLEHENSLLSSRSETQNRLLRALAHNHAGHQDLIRLAQEMSQENQALKEKARRQASLLHQLVESIPRETEPGRQVRQLLSQRDGLDKELADSSNRLESLLAANGSPSLPASVDLLSEETDAMRVLVRSKQTVLDAIQDPKGPSTEDARRIMEQLRLENQHLQHLLDVKRQTIKDLGEGGVPNPRLFNALIKLKEESTKLRRQLEDKTSLGLRLNMERKRLKEEVEGLSRELAKASSKARDFEWLMRSLKDMEGKLAAAKKEAASYKHLYQSSQVERDRVVRSFEKLNQQYEALVHEYEMIFRQFDPDKAKGLFK